MGVCAFHRGDHSCDLTKGRRRIHPDEQDPWSAIKARSGGEERAGERSQSGVSLTLGVGQETAWRFM